jgi:hypothetical protein
MARLFSRNGARKCSRRVQFRARSSWPPSAELSARPSRLLFSHRWTGQSIAPLGRRRSARLQHSSVMYSRTHPTFPLSGPSPRSRPSYLEALPSPCGTPSGGRRASDRLSHCQVAVCSKAAPTGDVGLKNSSNDSAVGENVVVVIVPVAGRTRSRRAFEGHPPRCMWVCSPSFVSIAGNRDGRSPPGPVRFKHGSCCAGHHLKSVAQVRLTPSFPGQRY